MMEASVASQDAGHSSPLTGPLDPPSIPSSSPLSPPLLPSHPPARPCRPKPPPPPASKSSQLPSRPPFPPSTPPSLPPPLPPAPPPAPSSLSPNPTLPPSLPPPLSPIPASPPPPLISDLTLSLTPSLPPPLSPTVSPIPPSLPPPTPVTPPPSPSPAPPPLSFIDKLIGSASVWKPAGLSEEQTTTIMEKEEGGAFLVHSTEDKATMLSVRQPEEPGAPLVHKLTVKQHKTFVHLEGSSLVFDDIFKLISFYCVSRDVLLVPLRLPQAITTATKKEELEVISAMGADFWTSDMNQHRDQTTHPDTYLYLNPVTVEDRPNKEPKSPAISKIDISSNLNTSPVLQNGVPEKITLQVKGPSKSAPPQEMKYKRPPPRPPSLSPGSGMGLLFSASSSPSMTSEAERKEDAKGGAGEKEERKSASTSPPHPSRPPVPPQSRSAPPLPPAPIRRASSSGRGTGREVGEGTEREKGQNPARKSEREGGGERGKEKAGLLAESKIQPRQDEEDAEKEEKTTEKEDKQKSAALCPPPPAGKRPSRPVPPPRTKPFFPNSSVSASQAGGQITNQSAAVRVPPPSPARRPDVSLYSPQGGAVLGTDPDSCSNSSTEEEAEPNQDQEQSQNRIADSRSPKAAVRRTPTTIMLDRARYRLSTVITGLISHERRLTQRIVELARDPASYFGNLVKEHRAFTLETMSKHATSTELLQEIRQMMTQLKSYLLQSSELQAMLEPQHQYPQDKLENIVEAALCKSVLKPLREPIYKSLEHLHSSNDGLKQLAQNQSVVLGSTTTALGVTTAVPEASAMEKISIKLNNLHQEYSPQKKIESLLKACKIIYDSMSVSSPGRAHGADDFLPVMMYVLARSNLSALQMDVEYMMELMDPSLTLGEGSYYLTTTYGALEHIKTFDQQRSATRQLSREVQDSIHRWERRRTLNQERVGQGSVRDFLTVCCPDFGSDPKTLGVLPTTTIQQLAEQCAARFEQDSYTLSVYMDGEHQTLAPTELALSVKNSCQPGTYCFVYHPLGQPCHQPSRTCPTDPPPAPPVLPQSAPTPADTAATPSSDGEVAAMEGGDEEEEEQEEEESLISL
ncbi:unnamed protein product [Ophioblennius macclurei]